MGRMRNCVRRRTDHRRPEPQNYATDYRIGHET
jgi:hypothetical protein